MNLILALMFSILSTCGLIAHDADAQVTSVSIAEQARQHLSWVEDQALRQQTIALARSGNPFVQRNKAAVCPAELPDLVGHGDTCLRYVELPATVMEDILLMNNHRFEVASDYDERITKFFVFAHGGTWDTSRVSDSRIKLLTTALGIKPEYVGNIRARIHQPSDRGFLRNLRGLFVGLEHQNETSLSGMTAGITEGKTVRMYTFGPEEVTLYPGGGFNVTYYLFVTETHLIYAKKEWWNS